MRPLYRALTDLVACAEDIVKRSPFASPPLRPEQFADLAADITAYDDKPAESVRTTRVAMVMLLAIENFFAEPHRPFWQSVIGMSLPELRDEAYRALQNEREQLNQEPGR